MNFNLKVTVAKNIYLPDDIWNQMVDEAKQGVDTIEICSYYLYTHTDCSMTESDLLARPMSDELDKAAGL